MAFSTPKQNPKPLTSPHNTTHQTNKPLCKLTVPLVCSRLPSWCTPGVSSRKHCFWLVMNFCFKKSWRHDESINQSHNVKQRFWYFDPRNPVVFTTNEMHSNIIVIVVTNNIAVSVYVSQWLSFYHWNQWLRFISCLFPETANDDADLAVATNDSACKYWMFLKS